MITPNVNLYVIDTHLQFELSVLGSRYEFDLCVGVGVWEWSGGDGGVCVWVGGWGVWWWWSVWRGGEERGRRGEGREGERVGERREEEGRRERHFTLLLQLTDTAPHTTPSRPRAPLVVLSVFTEYNSHWFQAPRGTLPVMGAMTMVLPGSIGIYVHIRASGLRAIPSLTVLAAIWLVL